MSTPTSNSEQHFQLINHPVISQRYFFPRSGAPKNIIDFQGYDGTRLRCSELRPYEQAKTLIHFHGNGEIVADYDDGYLSSLVEQLGVNVIMVEYRGYGDSQGQCELGKMLRDVTSVREQCGLLPADTILYGRSVGAIFAVEWAAQEPGIAGLILESGVANPHQRLVIRMEAHELGTDDATLLQACDTFLDHEKKLANFRGPMLVLHAAQDTLVGPEHAQAHMEYCPSERKRLVLFPRGGHNTILGANWSDYLAELSSFVKDL